MALARFWGSVRRRRSVCNTWRSASADADDEPKMESAMRSRRWADVSDRTTSATLEPCFEVEMARRRGRRVESMPSRCCEVH
eukprot:scaffold167896_cov30-Tisochrysis_lutea.AAC.1